MRSLERVRALIAGQPVDHLPVQPVVMMFAARHLGIPYIDYTRDGRKMAAAQSKLVRDFGIDCLLTCSDPAREVIDIAGEGSIGWYEDQGPAICEERAALLDKARLKTFTIPDPLGGGRMHDRIKGIEFMHEEFGGEVSIVGWVEGPLALAAELRGLTRSMTDFLDDAAFMKDLLDFTAEVAVVYAEAEIQAGADTIGMSDAAASMMGPKYYSEFLFPRQRRVVESIRQAHPEVIVRLHMCGNTDPLIAQMKQLPVQIFELDSPTNLAAARACLGPDRVILGNVATIPTCWKEIPRRSTRHAGAATKPVGSSTLWAPGARCRPRRHRKIYTPWSGIRASTRRNSSDCRFVPDAIGE